MVDPESGIESFNQGDEMEVDFGGGGPVIGQCTDEGDVSASAMVSGLKKFERLTLYDSSLVNISNRLESQFSTLQSYKIADPIGGAILLSSNQTADPGTHLPSVCTDMQTMSNVLREGGWNILNVGYSLKKSTFLSYLDSLHQVHRLEEYSVFLLYYTGHGIAQGVVLNDGGMVPYSHIVTTVSSIPCLKEKPKIFIFDSCREKGSSADSPAGNYVTMKNQFCMEIEDAVDQDRRNSGSTPYPPPHTLLCFSAAEGMPSLMDKVEGSFYTLALSHAFKQFGHYLSFPEIITQVSGGTKEIVRSLEKDHQQHPIFMSTLDKQLVLDSKFGDDCVERDYGTHSLVTAYEESQHNAKDSLVIKGGQHDGEYSCADVEKDTVPKDSQSQQQWESREHVMSSLKTLGNGISVFFLYAPNPEDPYKQAGLYEGKPELRNKFFMSRLFFDLELHGFHVVSDLHQGDTQPSNWVQWYITRISHCNFVVFVCSPAFKTLFEDSVQVDKLSNPKARHLVDYRNAVYAGISREMLGEGRKKFIPVILDENYMQPGQLERSVPLLFQAGTVYHVCKEEQKRNFDFDNKHRHFEKLVCHMAGIDRIALEKKMMQQHMGVPPPLFQHTTGFLEDDDEDTDEPPPGYVTSSFRPSPSLVGAPRPPTSVMGHQIPPVQQIPSHQPHPYPHPQPHCQPHPQPHPQPQQPQSHLRQQSQVTIDDLNAFPQTLCVPKQPIYLWLSERIVQWKFFARHLQLSERDIEEIVNDYQGTSECCFQMLRKWEQRFAGGQECSYRKLGEVLRTSEQNKHLCEEYVGRVKRLEQLDS